MHSNKTPHLDSRRGRLGQGLVEFALIVPVFLFFLLLAIDFGRLLFTYVQLNNAAREAASYAAFNPLTVPGNSAAPLTAIALRERNVQSQRGEGTLSTTSSCTTSVGVSIACADAQGGAGAGNRITVGVNERFTFLTPLINNFWAGGGLPIAASSTAAVVVFSSGGVGTAPSCTTVPPTPVFTFQSPDPVNRPRFISVDAGPSTSLASPCQNVGYNWDFGGTSSDSPANAEDPNREGLTQDYEYLVPGTYTITLVISNGAGDSPPKTQTITIAGSTPCNAPTANFTVSPSINLKYYKNNGNDGTAITFDGNSSAFMSDPACHPIWSWDLGDGSAAKTTPVVAGYHYNDNPRPWSGGTHTVNVKLTVKNDAGTNSKTVVLSMVED